MPDAAALEELLESLICTSGSLDDMTDYDDGGDPFTY